MSTDPLPEIEPPRPTPAEERERGRQARSRISLGDLGRVRRAVGSIDPVAILGEQAKMRIAELVPIRHQRMLASAFGFYRGGAAIMAADLASSSDTGLWAQLCGDAHLANFGLYETAERAQVFDINDFDETAPGPFEWDVKRLATSFEVASSVLGFEPADRRRIVVAAAREYRHQMLRFADMGHLDVWYERLDAAGAMERLSHHVTSGDVRTMRHGVHKSLQHNHLTAFSKLIETTNGRTRFISQPPLLVPIEELLDETGRTRYQSVIRSFLREYRNSLRPDRRHLTDQYRFVHVARKVVGVGSVGTRAWVALFIGRDSSDPLLLQLKEAQASVLEPYTSSPPGGRTGKRVVLGQRLMQAASDPLLGWYRLPGLDNEVRSFYARQLWDGKASVDVTRLSAQGLVHYAEICGWVLAKAHARSGPRLAIAAYLGDTHHFETAMAEFASAYAEVNQNDFQQLGEAVADGRLSAAADPDA
jgi:uncharacterized protein (DUF2252 family)